MTKVVAAFTWIALVLFVLISLYALFVGITFGGALWNPENFGPTWRWLGVVFAPVPIAIALRRWRDSMPPLLLSVVAAFALLAPYVTAISNR